MYTTFWYNNNDTVRVYYFSPVGNMDYSMVADINTINGKLQIYEGADKEAKLYMLFTNNHVQGYTELRDENIKRNAMNIVERAYQANGDKNQRLLYLHMKSTLDFNYTYFDKTNSDADDILNHIKTWIYIIYTRDASKDDYYIGITNDLDRRMQEHRERDFQIHNENVYAWLCKDADTTAEVEGRLGNDGYSIGGVDHGGNGGVADSRIVYLLKKA